MTQRLSVFSLLLASLFTMSISASAQTKKPVKKTTNPTVVQPSAAAVQAGAAVKATTPVTVTANAYTTPASTAATTTGTPMPASTSTGSTQTGTPNGGRQQQLYDEMHGVRPATATTTTQPTNSRTNQRTQSTQSGQMTSGQGGYGVNSPARTMVAPSSEGIQIGIRGGVNYLTYIRNKPVGDFTPDLIGHGGIVFNTGGQTVSFQPEVIYDNLGVKAVSSGLTAKAIQGAIEVPLLAKFSFGDVDATRFFIVVGPYAQYVLSQKVSATLAGQSIDESLPLGNFKDRFSYGATGGLGVAIPAGPGKFTVEGRVLWGLGNLDAFKSADGLILQGSIGYLFSL